MQIFLVERFHPATLDLSDAELAALHSRWASDVYLEVGAVWYGAVIAGDCTYGLVAADDASVIERYSEKLGISPSDIKVTPVTGFLGPAVAMARDDPRFRPHRRP